MSKAFLDTARIKLVIVTILGVVGISCLWAKDEKNIDSA